MKICGDDGEGLRSNSFDGFSEEEYVVVHIYTNGHVGSSLPMDKSKQVLATAIHHVAQLRTHDLTQRKTPPPPLM